MKKGCTRLAMLMLLTHESLSGYDIMKIIEKKTMGLWRLTPGGIYPNLKKLERKGYVKGRWESKGGRKKKLYTITDEGRHLVEAALQRQQQMVETIGRLFREFAQEVLGIQPSSCRIDNGLIFPLFGERLEREPVKEQIRIMKRARSKMCKTIKLIDKKVEELITKTEKSMSGDDDTHGFLRDERHKNTATMRSK